MVEGGERPRFALFDACWAAGDSERAFVSRAIAGAVACHGVVDVFVPGPNGPSRPDGAFDVTPLGDGAGGDSPWPSPRGAQLPDRRYAAALVVGADDSGADDLARQLVGERVFTIAAGPGAAAVTSDVDTSAAASSRRVLDVMASDPHRSDGGTSDVGCFVEADAAASRAPFNGIGCTDYVLVLASPPKSASSADDGLVAAAPWLIARFPRTFVLTLAEGTVTVWQHRSPLGNVRVGTRIDLLRLLAFARVAVDPRPGEIIARECIESLRLGTPIVVPDGGVAAAHAARGGATYRDVAQLLAAVEVLSESPTASAVGARGQRYADERFGSARRFIDRVGAAVAPDNGSR